MRLFISAICLVMRIHSTDSSTTPISPIHSIQPSVLACLTHLQKMNDKTPEEKITNAINIKNNIEVCTNDMIHTIHTCVLEGIFVDHYTGAFVIIDEDVRRRLHNNKIIQETLERNINKIHIDNDEKLYLSEIVIGLKFLMQSLFRERLMNDELYKRILTEIPSEEIQERTRKFVKHQGSIYVGMINSSTELQLDTRALVWYEQNKADNRLFHCQECMHEYVQVLPTPQQRVNYLIGLADKIQSQLPHTNEATRKIFDDIFLQAQLGIIAAQAEQYAGNIG